MQRKLSRNDIIESFRLYQNLFKDVKYWDKSEQPGWASLPGKLTNVGGDPRLASILPDFKKLLKDNKITIIELMNIEPPLRFKLECTPIEELEVVLLNNIQHVVYLMTTEPTLAENDFDWAAMEASRLKVQLDIALSF